MNKKRKLGKVINQIQGYHIRQTLKTISNKDRTTRHVPNLFGVYKGKKLIKELQNPREAERFIYDLLNNKPK